MKRSLSLVLALLMVVCIFSACSASDGEKREEKRPSDEELIEGILKQTSDAICLFDMEKASEYTADGSDVEKALLSVPSEIEDGIDRINESVSEIIDNNKIFKIMGENTKKAIKGAISDGLGKGKTAILDSVEVSFGTPEIRDDKASAQLTIRVGGKKFISFADDMSEKAAMDVVMGYLDTVLEKRGESYFDLLSKTEEILTAVMDEIINEITNGEKQEFKLVVNLEKTDGEWLISEIEPS